MVQWYAPIASHFEGVTYMPLLNDYMASTSSNGHSTDKVSPGYYAPFVVSLHWCCKGLCYA